MKKKIIIGSRGSKLALLYAEKAKQSIIENNEELNEDSFEIKIIKTEGDINQTQRLSEIGGKGLFSKTIEKELLNKNIDIAVHALKDLPSLETEGLVAGVYLKRNDLITKLIRGNVDTRIKKLEENKYQAIILALAGVKMLQKEEKISQIFSVNEILPSVGQGIISIQSRIEDKKINNIIKKANHEETSLCAIAEREMLKVLGGDCETAVAGFASIKDKKIYLNCELFSIDGMQKFTFNIVDSKYEAKHIGYKAGISLISQAGDSYKIKK